VFTAFTVHPRGISARAFPATIACYGSSLSQAYRLLQRPHPVATLQAGFLPWGSAPLQHTKLSESPCHRSGRPVSKPEQASPLGLFQTLRGLLLVRALQPCFMPLVLVGFSYSPGCFPLTDPDRIHHPADPSRRSPQSIRRSFKVRPQGMPSAKVRCHRQSIASTEGPIPSRALRVLICGFLLMRPGATSEPLVWGSWKLIRPWRSTSRGLQAHPSKPPPASSSSH